MGKSQTRAETIELDKSPEAFRTISEVAEAMDLPQHVLRFWETRFPQIKPLKRGGGRRYYRPDDIELLQAIKGLLYGEGYTIKGVQKLFKEQGARAVVAGGPKFAPTLGATPSGEATSSASPAARGGEPSLSAPTSASAMKRGLSPSDIAQLREALGHIVEGNRLLSQAQSISR